MDAVHPGWDEEPIKREWARYAHSQMGELVPLQVKNGLIGLFPRWW